MQALSYFSDFAVFSGVFSLLNLVFIGVFCVTLILL